MYTCTANVLMNTFYMYMNVIIHVVAFSVPFLLFPLLLPPPPLLLLHFLFSLLSPSSPPLSLLLFPSSTSSSPSSPPLPHLPSLLLPPSPPLISLPRSFLLPFQTYDISCKHKVKALKKLSLNMYEGQITAFLGHNGAGKTTTM